MDDGSFQGYIDSWRQQYQLLLDESSTLLRNFDTICADGAVELIAKRQQTIDGFQKFDNELKSRLSGGASDQRILEEFRLFQKEITAKILEQDGLVIALAKERLRVLKGELAGLAKCRTVANAYEGSINLSGRRQVRNAP